MKPLLFALALAAPALAADPVPVAPIAGTRLAVTASASVARTPDVATIGTGVVTQGRTAAAALADNARAMAQVVAALKAAGVASRDLQTSAVSLDPQYRYADNQPPVLTGYQATNRVSVRLRDLARVGQVLDALAAAGANQIDGPDFGIDQPAPALDEARTKAIAAARARADLYARAAGMQVRRIVAIDEAEGAPPVARPMLAMAARAKADTPVESGEQALTATVNVTFELQ